MHDSLPEPALVYLAFEMVRDTALRLVIFAVATQPKNSASVDRAF